MLKTFILINVNLLVCDGGRPSSLFPIAAKAKKTKVSNGISIAVIYVKGRT